MTEHTSLAAHQCGSTPAWQRISMAARKHGSTSVWEHIGVGACQASSTSMWKHVSLAAHWCGSNLELWLAGGWPGSWQSAQPPLCRQHGQQPSAPAVQPDSQQVHLCAGIMQQPCAPAVQPDSQQAHPCFTAQGCALAGQGPRAPATQQPRDPAL